MLGLIVFNNANDVAYQKFDLKMLKKLKEIAIEQGLIDKESEESPTETLLNMDSNIVLQIFSPIINSQKLMHCQFDNTYASFQCENGLNFVFGEFLGFTFLKFGQFSLSDLKRFLGVSMALVRYLYGPNLFAVQANQVQEELLTICLDCYEKHFWMEDQTMMIEAMPRLLINMELKKMIKTTLDAALEYLREMSYTKAHVILFVGNKVCGVASSKQALTISSSDILYISLLKQSLEVSRKPLNRSDVIFLQGLSHDPCSGCIPVIIHFSQLDKGVVLVQLVEYANLHVASSLYDTFFVLHKIMALQMQGDVDGLKQIYENLEQFVKQSLDAIKKAKLKSDELDGNCLKRFHFKWDSLKKMYNEFFKGFDKELLVRIESNIPGFLEELKQLFTLTCCDSSGINLNQLPDVANLVENRMFEFIEFLAVKAERNISINAYLEDFPGLVHFIYVNRSTGLMIAPDLNLNEILSKKNLWQMIEFTRNYLKKGQTSIMWKDKAFNYSYFLWFEDQAGVALKTIDLQQHFLGPNGSGNSPFKPHFEPGLLAFDYYQLLTEVCFPKLAPGKVKCYELFCIHLGLVTATCAAEHSRRLIATIADVVGEDSL